MPLLNGQQTVRASASARWPLLLIERSVLPCAQRSIRSCLGRAASSCRPTLHGYCWLFSTDHQNTRMIAIGSSALAASYAYLYEYYREIVATGISMQNRLLLYIQTDHYSMGRQQ